MFIADLHLALGGVDIDVQFFRWQIDKDGEERISSFGKDEPIDLIEMKRDIFILHRPAVDKDKLHIPPSPADIDIAQR